MNNYKLKYIKYKKKYLLSGGAHLTKLDINDHTCSICLNNTNPVDYLTICGHYYHQECINNWFNSSNNKVNKPCPYCKKNSILDTFFIIQNKQKIPNNDNLKDKIELINKLITQYTYKLNELKELTDSINKNNELKNNKKKKLTELDTELKNKLNFIDNIFKRGNISNLKLEIANLKLEIANLEKVNEDLNNKKEKAEKYKKSDEERYKLSQEAYNKSLTFLKDLNNILELYNDSEFSQFTITNIDDVFNNLSNFIY